MAHLQNYRLRGLRICVRAQCADGRLVGVAFIGAVSLCQSTKITQLARLVVAFFFFKVIYFQQHYWS